MTPLFTGGEPEALRGLVGEGRAGGGGCDTAADGVREDPLQVPQVVGRRQSSNGGGVSAVERVRANQGGAWGERGVSTEGCPQGKSPGMTLRK